MRRIIFSVVICLIVSGPALASVVIEPFNYSTGNIGSQTSTATNGNKWGAVYYFGLKLDGYHDVVSGSLSAPAGYGYTPTHNSLQGSNGDSIMDIVPAHQISFDADGVFYMSFLINVPNATTQNGAGGWAGLSGESAASVLAIGEDPDDGITKGGLTVASFGHKTKSSTTFFQSGVDTLVVAKVTTVSGSGNDKVEVSLFPSTGVLTAEPTTWDHTHNAPLYYTGQGLYFSSYSQTTFDEFRIGDSYAAVTNYTPAPEPATAALLMPVLLLLRRGRRAA